MPLNEIELDLKTKLIESRTTQTEVAEKVEVSLAYVYRIQKAGSRL
jgi:DNA-directed RNA polymerase specialized sigma subunit